MKPRRPRSDSADAALRAAHQASLPPLEPPAGVVLTKRERLSFDGIIHSRLRASWNPRDLALAVELARCHCAVLTRKLPLRERLALTERGMKLSCALHLNPASRMRRRDAKAVELEQRMRKIVQRSG